MRNFRKIPLKYDYIHSRRYFILQVKCLYLLSDCIQNYIFFREWAQSEWYGVPGKSLVGKTTYCVGGTFYSKQNALNYLLLGTKPICFVGRGSSVAVVEFHENPSNGRRDKAETVIFAPSTVPSNIDLSRPNLHALWGTWCNLWRFGKLQLWTGDTADKVLCSPSKLLIINARLLPN